MTDTKIGPFTKAHVIYITTLGILASGLLGTLLALKQDLLVEVRHDPEAFVIFLTTAFVARLLSVRMAGMVTFTLDTGVYVTALLLLGTGAAILIVFLAMLLRGLVDLVTRELSPRQSWPPFVSAARLLFGPSITSLIVACIGLIFEPQDALRAANDLWVLLVAYVGATILLVVPQFAAVSLGYYLNALPFKRIVSEVIIPGLSSEIVFIPLGFSLAAVYRAKDLPALLSLAVAYLVFGEVFRRMWLKSQAAKERAEDLALVEEAGRAAASTLDIEEIGRRIGSILLRAINGSLGMVFIARGPEGGKGITYVRAKDRSHKPAIYQAVLKSLGASDFSASEGAEGPPTSPLARGKGPQIGDIISRPMVGPDGVDVGHISLVLEAKASITERERRLVQSIARQAAIAVENWRLYSMATVDGLTGLYIRRYLEARLREEFERAQRSGTKFCVMMLDVDNLKDVNDAFGHAAGDTLLRQVASAVKESIRGMDVAARWGGDEFAVLLPDMDIEAGLAVARRLAAAIQRKTFMAGTERITPSASIGVAACAGPETTDPLELIAAADQALYQAKRSGARQKVVAITAQQS